MVKANFNLPLIAAAVALARYYAKQAIKAEWRKRGLRWQYMDGRQLTHEAKVYLNGHEVYGYRGPGRILRSDEGRATSLTLRQGTNVLVFKVVNEQTDWKGCLRFVDADGKPVSGLRVRLGGDVAEKSP